MTLYSCLPSQGKVTVLATWAGEFAESHSAKVTTCADPRQAADLADELTCVSEAMWDAAAWLDVYDHAEATLAAVVEATRQGREVPLVGDLDFAGCRHAESWTGDDLTHHLGLGLPQTLNGLSQAQRLSVADELVADADARATSLKLLPGRVNPDRADSRMWQVATVGRVTHSGFRGGLPNGASGWLERAFDTGRAPVERWAARNLLHRLEQLAAAAKTINGRGGADDDPLEDHLVFPAELFGVHLDRSSARARVDDDIDPAVVGSALVDAYREYAASVDLLDGDAVVNVRPDFDLRNVAPWDRDVFTKVNVTLRTRGSAVPLATLDPADSAGFAAALGDWVSRASYRG